MTADDKKKSNAIVDEDVVRALARLLDETGLTEIEIAEKDSRIRVVRAPAPVGAVAADRVPVAQVQAAAELAAAAPAMATSIR